MFKKHLINLAVMWLIVVFFYFLVFRTTSLDDQMAYQSLMQFNTQVEKEQMKEEARATQQTRYQVSKQIFYKEDLHRLQSRLSSESSELIFNSKGERAELVEYFKELSCVMQEKFIDESTSQKDAVASDLQPKQYIRCFNAHQGVYFYKTGQLEAEDVEVAHYLVPGILWPASLNGVHPLLQGQAQKLQLSLFKEPSFRAQGFQAAFHDLEGEW